LIFLSSVFMWYTEGVSKVQEIFSPFSLFNSFAILVSLSPGFGAYLIAERLTKRNARRLLESADALVHAYARVLQGVSSVAVDDARLPAPKDAIKAALLLWLSVEQDPQVRSLLKINYLSLAIFQPGVGEADLSLNAFMKARPPHDQDTLEPRHARDLAEALLPR
jgi:hypothetical protein